MNIYNFIPKYIKQHLEDPSRHKVLAERWNELWNLTITQGDWNAEAIKMLCDTLADSIIDYSTQIADHKLSGDHDARYYTKEYVNLNLATKAENELKADKANVYTKDDIDLRFKGGDTIIRREVFIIVNSDNGDGTFTYKDVNNVEYIGMLGLNGEQIFTLQKGTYTINEERIEITINDTLQRSATSGGLEEIDETHVALTIPEADNTEITIKYFERIAIIGLGLINISPYKPKVNSVWFKVVS